MVLRTSDVAAVLSGFFWEGMDPDRDCAGACASLLRHWMPGQPPEEVDDRLQSLILRQLRRELGESLLVRDAQGWRRIRSADLAAASDRVMGVLFSALPEDSCHYAVVRDYFFRTGSLSALQCLCCRFADQQSPEELDLARRILRDRLGSASG